jgi:hypothetical protein
VIGVLGAAAVLGGAMAGIGLPAVPVEAAQVPSLVQATTKPSPTGVGPAQIEIDPWAMFIRGPVGSGQ